MHLNKIIGKKIGFLTAIEEMQEVKNNKKNTYLICKGDCGNYTKVLKSNFVRGHTKSCGCFARKKASERMIKNNPGWDIEKALLTPIKKRGGNKCI